MAMSASKLFSDLISKIENCGLNYKISKTPFSATISLKSTLVKYYNEPERLENRNNNLKIESEESVRLEEILKHEQSKVKSLETELESFREELLKIKKEKNKLNLQNKAIETENGKLKEEKDNMKKAAKDLEANLKVKREGAEAKTVECSKLNKDNGVLRRKIVELISESEIKKKENNDAKKEFKCSKCDFEFDSLVELGQHIRILHSKDQVSQTTSIDVIRNDVFSEYPCHYCRKILTSVLDLEDHKPICYTIRDFGPFPCDVCGAQCSDEAGLGDHRTYYHKLGTYSENLGVELFWCDVCPLNFKSSPELDEHLRGCHKA